jgi:hypothetical protein
VAVQTVTEEKGRGGGGDGKEDKKIEKKRRDERIFMVEGRPGRTWKDNIRMNLREVVWEGVDWIHLAQDRDQ